MRLEYLLVDKANEVLDLLEIRLKLRCQYLTQVAACELFIKRDIEKFFTD